MATIDPTTIMSEPRTLYLEGIKTRYKNIVVTGTDSGYATISVTVPFKNSVRALRAKTSGRVFFGNSLFVLAEGELVQKSPSVGPTGPTMVLTFNGVMGNVAFIKYAAIADGQGGVVPSTDVTMANPALFTILNGTSVAGNVDAIESPLAYKANTVNKNIIAAVFEQALKGTKSGAQFDMPEVFREIAKKILYADETNPDVSGIFARGAATTPLSAVDRRFRLIDSIVGATNQELIAAFYGAGDAEDDLNPFLSAVLSENNTGEHSVMEVFRLLADRAYHDITEMVAPPFLAGADGTKVLGRMMVVPKLFSADPPACNVFLKRMCTGVTPTTTALKATRLIMSQHFPMQNNTPTAVMSIAPAELANAVIGGDSKSVKLFASLTQEESEVGVLAQNISNAYGSSFPLDGDINMLIAWFKKTNALRFLDVRTEGQGTAVSMEFNPFVAVGFPGLFFDPFLGAGRGFVKSVTHTITETSASTSVLMDHCVNADAMEYTAPSTDIETGFDGELQSYQNGAVSEIYEKTLGCQSLSKAAEALIGAASPTPGVSHLAVLAEAVNGKLSESARTADDKTEIYRFITRSVASYQDLLSFYQPNAGAAPAGIPDRLAFGNTEIDASASPAMTITIKPMDASATEKTMDYVVDAPPTEEAVLGSNGIGIDQYQVVDRVQAVINYVNEVG